MATKIRPAAAGAKRVVLHIGAPKTGTTYLQHDALQQPRAARGGRRALPVR